MNVRVFANVAPAGYVDGIGPQAVEAIDVG